MEGLDSGASRGRGLAGAVRRRPGGAAALGRGAGSRESDAEPALLCQRCQAVLNRSQAGEWVATYPDRAVHGYHVSALWIPTRSLADIVAGLSETDESKRQQVYNQGLGLPYKSRGAVSLSDDVLDACRREYALGPKRGGAFCGIDVGRVLHVVIRGADWSLRAAFEHADFDGGVSLVDEVVVFSSELTPDGPVHEPLCHAELKGH